MGNFYTNITLTGPRQDEILDHLRSNLILAFVSPTSDDGATVIYERESEEQDVEVLDGVASMLSTRFSCPALAALDHDDDVLLLRLHDRGALTFAYDSQEFFHPG